MKKLLCVLLSLTLLVPFAAQAFAENGPFDKNLDGWYPTFLQLTAVDEKGEPVMEIVDGWEVNKSLPLFVNNEAIPQENAAYDRAANTLTLTDFSDGSYVLAANMMGDDFTLNLVGDNRLARITVWGDGWGGSLRITGTGTLKVNEKKIFDSGILFYPEGAENQHLAMDVGPQIFVYGKKTAVEVAGDDGGFKFLVEKTELPMNKEKAVREQYVWVDGYAGTWEREICLADCASDPDGIYAISYGYKDETMTELVNVEVQKYVYVPALGLTLPDLRWPEEGETKGSSSLQFDTPEAAAAAGFTRRLDGDGNEIWQKIATVSSYGSFSQYEDADGNGYMLSYEYDDERGAYYVAMTMEPIESMPGYYYFREAPGVDVETLKEKTEIVTYDDMFDYSFVDTEFTLEIKPGFKPGDVDGNGEIEVEDARLALRASVGLNNYEPASREFKAADTDADDEIEVSDARNILRAAVGLDQPEDWAKQ